MCVECQIPGVGDDCRCDCHAWRARALVDHAPHDKVMEIARRIIERDSEILARLADGPLPSTNCDHAGEEL